jgi:hypothetical protein
VEARDRAGAEAQRADAQVNGLNAELSKAERERGAAKQVSLSSILLPGRHSIYNLVLYLDLSCPWQRGTMGLPSR